VPVDQHGVAADHTVLPAWNLAFTVNTPLEPTTTWSMLASWSPR
jgi:hypothetical protein